MAAKGIGCTRIGVTSSNHWTIIKYEFSRFECGPWDTALQLTAAPKPRCALYARMGVCMVSQGQ